VDLKISRNLTILGLASIMGIVIPTYVEASPIDVGVRPLNEMFNILLTTRMFVGAVIAFVLDNVSGGATIEQRGLPPCSSNLSDESKYDGCFDDDGYSFSDRVNRHVFTNLCNQIICLI
jgi:hypothetical protein